jgi:inorganic triphosphatase YgiF
MEIEAKFSIPNQETFKRLKQVGSMIGYRLSGEQVKNVRDHYLDTASQSLLAHGYACRRREQSGQMLITLKGLGGVEGAIHRREELEVQLQSAQPPQAWPPGPVRERVLQLVGDEPLKTLFILQQKRHVRQVSQEQLVVAELSLDAVWLEIDGRHTEYFELEIEQSSPGQENHLTTLAGYLQQQWHLKPETLSKFERGLAFAGTAPTK